MQEFKGQAPSIGDYTTAGIDLSKSVYDLTSRIIENPSEMQVLESYL